MNRKMVKSVAFLLVLICSLMFACKSTSATNANVANSESKIGSKVYFAAALFNESEREYNLRIASILESYGYEVFLPQRDGLNPDILKGKSDEEIIEIIFENDVEEINKADILFAVLDGAVPDEGMCVEIGIAYASGKRCYGIRNDLRVSEHGFDLNLMIAGCFDKIFKDTDYEKLISSFKEYLSNNRL